MFKKKKGFPRGGTKINRNAALGLLIGAVGVIVIGAVFFTYVYVSNQTTNLPQPAPSAVELKLNQEQAIATVINSGDMSKCASLHGTVIDGTDYETACTNDIAYAQAMTNADLTACNKLDNVSMSVTDCQHQVINAQLQSKGTDGLAYCQTISDQNLATYCNDTYAAGRAADTKDPKYCNQMSDAPSRKACAEGLVIAQLKATPASINCASLPASYRSECNILKTARTESDCVKIHNSIMLQNCLSNVQ